MQSSMQCMFFDETSLKKKKYVFHGGPCRGFNGSPKNVSLGREEEMMGWYWGPGMLA